MRARAVWVVVGALALQGCGQAAAGGGAAASDAALLHTAMGQLTNVIVYDIFSPPQASRAYAYASVAAYEALRHDHPGYRSLAGQLNELTPAPAPQPGAEYHLPLASIHAFMTVGRALTFSQDRMDSLRTAMHEHFREAGIPAPVFARSVAYGDSVAQHVLAWARKDRFHQRVGLPKFTVTTEPGRWVPTPPGYMDAVEPNWATLRPFVLDSAGQFRPKAPHAYDMREGSAFHQQVKEVYDVGRTLTDEQRAIAEFWDDNPFKMNVRGHAMFATKKISPVGHWMAITAVAADKANADLMRSAEAYVRTAVAIADGFISCWDAKYQSNLLRPETAINAHLDETWEPLLQTPPFPEYPSGHSVISTAAAEVLTDLFGDDFAYEDTTQARFGIPARSFPSFRAAAAEAAISRLYGGIHYRMGIDEGVVEGRQVGAHVLQRVRTRVETQVATTAAPRR